MNSETPKPDTSKIVDTRISAVTVYTDRARVTRRAIVALNGEERELVIAGLPVTLDTETVRTTGAGTVAVRLLGVRTERIYATEPVAGKVTQLSQEIQRLEEQQRGVADLTASLLLQRDFIQSLSEKSVERFSRSLAQQQVGLDETRALLKFVGQQYSELSAAIARHEKQQQEIEKQLQARRHQLQQMLSPHPKESFSLVVTIEPTTAGDFELEVSYVVAEASWTPLYDVQVSDTGDTVNLSYLAEVQQRSGEDWIGVSLTLSTAKPGMGTLPPKLHPWYIDVPIPVDPFKRAMASSIPPMAGAIRMRKSADLPDSEETDEIFEQMIAAETVAVEVSTQGGVVTFQLNGGSNIPSDGAPHKVAIFNDDYPCQLEYIAIPRLVSFAYLQASVTNPSTGATVLPGKANIFRNNTFVGTTQLENIAPGQEFKLNLGIDESLKIERDLIEQEVDKRFLGNQRRITYAYRLVINNLSRHPVNLKVTEQLPVSRNEQIKVRLTRSTPQIQLSEMGMLVWSLTLPPLFRQELYYQFTVEHPPELNVVGLDI